MGARRDSALALVSCVCHVMRVPAAGKGKGAPIHCMDRAVPQASTASGRASTRMYRTRAGAERPRRAPGCATSGHTFALRPPSCCI